MLFGLLTSTEPYTAGREDKKAMNNRKIRTAIFESDLKKYEIANKIGITPFTLSHWLQTEMSQEQKQIVLKAIKDLKN